MVVKPREDDVTGGSSAATVRFERKMPTAKFSHRHGSYKLERTRDTDTDCTCGAAAAVKLSTLIYRTLDESSETVLLVEDSRGCSALGVIWRLAAG